MVEGFNERRVVKIATHPEARHFLALTAEGAVYSWGCGELGQLGHGDNRYSHNLLYFFKYKFIIMLSHFHHGYGDSTICFKGFRSDCDYSFLYCDYSWLLCIVIQRGFCFSAAEIPTQVMALVGKNVVQIHCSSSRSMVITSSGEMYSWGRSVLSAGLTDDYTVPTLVTAFAGMTIVDVTFGNSDGPNLVLTNSGENDIPVKNLLFINCDDL